MEDDIASALPIKRILCSADTFVFAVRPLSVKSGDLSGLFNCDLDRESIHLYVQCAEVMPCGNFDFHVAGHCVFLAASWRVSAMLIVLSGLRVRCPRSIQVRMVLGLMPRCLATSGAGAVIVEVVMRHDVSAFTSSGWRVIPQVSQWSPVSMIFNWSSPQAGHVRPVGRGACPVSFAMRLWVSAMTVSSSAAARFCLAHDRLA